MHQKSRIRCTGILNLSSYPAIVSIEQLTLRCSYLYMTYSDDLENIEIYAPDKSGKYEMEFLCIPNLSNAVINTEKEITVISSNRYTLEVE